MNFNIVVVIVAHRHALLKEAQGSVARPSVGGWRRRRRGAQTSSPASGRAGAVKSPGVLPEVSSWLCVPGERVVI